MLQKNKFRKYKNPKHSMSRVPCRMSQGFSLIEVLVTLFVLSAGLVGVSVLMANNIRSSENSKNQIIATQLAQEGIELVRNLKDNKQLDAAPYNNQTCIFLCTGLRVDKTLVLDSGGDKRLYLNGSFYTHTNTGTPTKFYRQIDLSITGDIAHVPSSDRVIKVTSYVSWNGTGIPGICNIANKCVSIVSKMPDL
jgi:prepilin-type N-terminal cleavage/methylation domain-containing protein